jgi:putative FmdB family regulatory protein
MPTYPWLCEKCDLEFETIESIHDYTGKKSCDMCGNPCTRIFTNCKFHFTGTKIEDAEYNVGLGKVTKSKAHREDLAKQLGVVEVGNDFKDPDNIHKKFDIDRSEKIKKSWEET